MRKDPQPCEEELEELEYLRERERFEKKGPDDPGPSNHITIHKETCVQAPN